jgi:RNA polymerase sigma-70 factor (ECF subfamily)
MDDDLRQLLAAGRHDEAFELLLPRYSDRVFRLVYGFLFNESWAEEVTQDIFVRIWKGLPGYDGRASLSTWIYTIARNTAFTARKRHRQHVSLDDPEFAQSMEHLPELQTSGREEGAGEDVQQFLAQLPDKYRQVITLFYLEQRSYEETAELLGVPMGTVKTYLHRARRELARLGNLNERLTLARS